MSTLQKILGCCIALLLLVVFWLACLNHVGAGECGVAYNSFSGTVSVQRPGWHFTSPLTRVATLPTTPFWVTIRTSATIKPRRLVQFLPEHADRLVALQGFNYYGSAFSAVGPENGAQDSAIAYLFVGYAFSGQPHPFLQVIE